MSTVLITAMKQTYIITHRSQIINSVLPLSLILLPQRHICLCIIN